MSNEERYDEGRQAGFAEAQGIARVDAAALRAEAERLRAEVAALQAVWQASEQVVRQARGNAVTQRAEVPHAATSALVAAQNALLDVRAALQAEEPGAGRGRLTLPAHPRQQASHAPRLYPT